MEQLEKKNIFSFFSYGEFLKYHFEEKSKSTPSFNYSAWARKLGMPTTASLTRILSGERQPGDKIIDLFNLYFKFSELEREYFRTLVLLDKEKDFLIRCLYFTRMNYLRQKINISPQLLSQNPVIKLNSKVLLLWGEADVDQMNKYLSEYGLESILNFGLGKASVCLKAAYNLETDIGSYPEFNFAAYVKKKDEPLVEYSMFMDKMLCPRLDVKQTWNKWGAYYDIAEIQADLNGRDGNSAVISSGDHEYLRFQMGPAEDLHEADQSNEMFGYNSVIGREYKSKIAIETTALSRDFNPETDSCKWNSETELGRFLDEIKFSPLFWSYHPKFIADIYPAIPK